MVRTLDSHPKAVSWVLGKLFYVVTGPQAQCEVRMDHVARPLHILLAKKGGGFDIVCLKLYKFERITSWCLSILKSILKYVMEFALQYVMLEKILEKSRSPGICVNPTLGGGPDENSRRP
jgi:hypothetical protein